MEMKWHTRAPENIRCFNCETYGHKQYNCPELTEGASFTLEGPPLEPIRPLIFNYNIWLAKNDWLASLWVTLKSDQYYDMSWTIYTLLKISVEIYISNLD